MISATGSPHAEASAGFTLIELLVVLAIMVGLAAAFPLAREQLDPAHAVRIYATRTLSDLRSLRAEALEHQHASQLVVDSGGHAYQLMPSGLRRTLPGSLRLHVESESESGFGADTEHLPTIAFFADGSSSGARLTLARDRYAEHLDVSPLSGRVHRE